MLCLLPNALDYRHGSLHSLSLADSKLSMDESVTLVSLFPNLTKLTNELDGPSLLKIIDVCPSMKEVKIKCTTSLPDSTVRKVVNAWTQLTNLTLVNVSVSDNGPVISEAAMLLVITQCKALKNLKLCTSSHYVSPYPTRLVYDSTKPALQMLLQHS